MPSAEGFASAPPPTGDSGRWGGNMDFNEIVEGGTVYLPVNQPGALLYVGDGHAAQGDGELNGNALETSMEVEFTVDVIHDKRISTPRVESNSEIMTRWVWEVRSRMRCGTPPAVCRSGWSRTAA